MERVWGGYGEGRERVTMEDFSTDAQLHSEILLFLMAKPKRYDSLNSS